MSDAVIRMGYSDKDLETGLARSASHVKRFEQQTRGLFGGLGSSLRSSLGSAAGFLGIGAGIGGMKVMLDQIDRIGDLAEQLEATPEAVQRIGIMAKPTTADLEKVVAALNKTDKALTTVAGKSAFRELGIDAARYKSLDADAKVIELAEAFQKAGDRGKALANVYTLMGRGAADMLPLLRGNIAEMKKMSEAKVISADQVEMVSKFNDTLDETLRLTMVGGGMLFDKLGDMFAGLKGMYDGRGFLPALDDRLEEKGKKLGDKSAATAKNRAASERQAKQEEIDALRGELEKARETTADQEEETVDKLTRARQKVRDIDEEIQKARDGGSETELLRLEVKREDAMRSMLSLQKQFNKEIKDAAEKQREKTEAITQLSTSIEAARLRASGKGKQADALEKEMRLRTEAQRIAKETAMSEQDALALLREKSGLEEKAARRHATRADGRHRTQGYSRSQRPAYHSALDDMYGSNSRREPFRPRYGNPGLDEFHRLNSVIPNQDGKLVRPTAFPVTVRSTAATKTNDQAIKALNETMRKVEENTAALRE